MSAKEVMELTGGVWFVEVQEMVAHTKAEVEHIKAFLSRQTDKARAAFGRRTTATPRQFVVFGTTNRDDYLSDQTGGRRFWPARVQLPEIDVATAVAERDQLWAEAKHRYEAGEFLDLEGADVKDAANKMRDERHECDEWETVIRQFIATPVPKGYYDSNETYLDWADNDDPFCDNSERRQTISSLEIWTGALGQTDISKLGRRESNRIFKILRKITGKNKSYSKKKRYGGGAAVFIL
jgi:predicted P-loop ATPase